MTAGLPAAIRARSAPAKSRACCASPASLRTAGNGFVVFARATSLPLTATMRARISATGLGPGVADEGVELLARGAAGHDRQRLLHAPGQARRQSRDIDAGA